MTRPTRTLLICTALLVGCGSATAAPIDLECDTPPSESAEEAVDYYFAGMNEVDPEARACMLQASLAADASLLAADGRVDGRPEVRVALEEDAADLFLVADNRELTRPVLFRHQEALLTWRATDDSGSTVEEGEDWLELADDGRLVRVHRFRGSGVPTSLTPELLAWQEAWNERDGAVQAAALDTASTEDVRFSDLLVDVTGRSAVLSEIRRQQSLLDGTLDLGEPVEVHVGDVDTPVLIRHDAAIWLPDGTQIEIRNFIRLEEGRIERLSGFPIGSL
ncbi:MAG: hypothetical protein AAF997_11985 [Myxococcota bacterium]